MSWLGVFLMIIGGWIVVSTVNGLIENPNRSPTSWYWQIVWLLGGLAAVYYGFKKVTAPPSVGLGVPVATRVAGRRK